MGFVKDAIGGVVGGVGDVLGSTVGKIPGIGDVVQAGLPIAGSVLGGPLGGALGGAVAGGMGEEGGPTGQGILQGAGQGLSTQQMLEAFRQQQADAERARELVNQGVDFSGQSADIAMNQFQQDQPLRQAFRQGAMNFSDPTNPFAQSAGAGMMPQPQPQLDPRIAQGGGQPAEPQGPPPGSLSSRVQGMLATGGSGGFQGATTPSPGDPANFREGRTTISSGGRASGGRTAGGGRSFGGINPRQQVESQLAGIRDRLSGMDIDLSQLPDNLRA